MFDLEQNICGIHLISAEVKGDFGFWITSSISSVAFGTCGGESADAWVNAFPVVGLEEGDWARLLRKVR